MRLEKQVCSLELSKKLKELGVKQDSLLWWMSEKQDRVADKYLRLQYCPFPDKRDLGYSAFTVAELGEKLPMEIPNRNGKYDGRYFETTKISGSWMIEYRKDKKMIANVLEKTEANARAKMLVYLIENKLIKL